MTIHKDYCSRCKRKNIPLVKYSKGRDGKIQYYHCRSCANERIKKYIATKRGLEVFTEIRNKTTAKYPEKFKARQAIAKALRNGTLIKPTNCESCNADGRIEGHHLNYADKLKVLWLCPPCHSRYHASMV